MTCVKEGMLPMWLSSRVSMPARIPYFSEERRRLRRDAVKKLKRSCTTGRKDWSVMLATLELRARPPDVSTRQCSTSKTTHRSVSRLKGGAYGLSCQTSCFQRPPPFVSATKPSTFQQTGSSPGTSFPVMKDMDFTLAGGCSSTSTSWKDVPARWKTSSAGSAALLSSSIISSLRTGQLSFTAMSRLPGLSSKTEKGMMDCMPLSSRSAVTSARRRSSVSNLQSTVKSSIFWSRRVSVLASLEPGGRTWTSSAEIQRCLAPEVATSFKLLPLRSCVATKRSLENWS
mmetsp:Transcript_84294/g.202071  ORF Transcript_84294/g.202071 Transcript_84294/m.202071 type:complete len:286 (+) Transcript_84294:26-883(+)